MLYEVSPVYVVSTIFQAVHNNPTAPNSLSLKKTSQRVFIRQNISVLHG